MYVLKLKVFWALAQCRIGLLPMFKRDIVNEIVVSAMG
jgi:hypothetical protein